MRVAPFHPSFPSANFVCFMCSVIKHIRIANTPPPIPRFCVDALPPPADSMPIIA